MVLPGARANFEPEKASPTGTGSFLLTMIPKYFYPNSQVSNEYYLANWRTGRDSQGDYSVFKIIVTIFRENQGLPRLTPILQKPTKYWQIYWQFLMPSACRTKQKS